MIRHIRILLFLSGFILFRASAVRGQEVGNCQIGKASLQFDGEDFGCKFSNDGSIFNDWPGSAPAYRWPKTNTAAKYIGYASAIWFSGKDLLTNNRTESAQTYGGGGWRSYWPGPVHISNNLLPSPTSDAICEKWDRIFIVRKAEVDSFLVIVESALGLLPDNQIPDNIKYWPARGNSYLKAQFGDLAPSLDQDLAPFVDADGDGVYRPPYGDYPAIGNRLAMAWWILNDVGNKKHVPWNSGTTQGSNLEFQFTASAYPSRPEAKYLKNSLFVDVKLINKGSAILDTCYLGVWAESDIGNPSDDFIQCHVMKNLAFTFNGDNEDEGPYGYGLDPPVFGYKITDGPRAYPGDGVDNNRDGVVDENGEKSLFAGFIPHSYCPPNANCNPDQNLITNRLMSRWHGGFKMSYDGFMGYKPVSSIYPECRFVYPGLSDPFGYGVGGSAQTPILMPEWTELTAGTLKDDRRSVMSAGPFQLPPGGVEHYSFATLVGYGGANNLDNINQLYAVSDSLDQLLPILNHRKVKDPGASTEAIVYPNPASNEIIVGWTKSQPVWYVEVLDFRGTVLKKIDLQLALGSRVHISLTNLPPGLYQAAIHQTDGEVKTKRFLKL